MRLYKVHVTGDFGGDTSRALWTQRKADIPRLQRELTERNHDDYAGSPIVEVVEFEPTVQGIVDMLNRHADL